MQLDEMLKAFESFDEKGEFCKNFPIHREAI